MNAFSANAQLSLGQCATLACIFESTARKPGNVHREADFIDLSYADFLASAVAIAPAIEAAACGTPVGRAVLEAVRATRSVATTNTYLGALLLLAPLAAVPREVSLATGISDVLRAFGPDDARNVYEAIRLSAAGGLGIVEEADVHGEPPADLVAAMRLAADSRAIFGPHLRPMRLSGSSAIKRTCA
jgi:triphosphoribosyl-dephospho-CoA synthase